MSAKAAKDLEKDMQIPDHLKMSVDVFDDAEGEEFGGASEILHPDENEAVGPLTYLGFRANVNLGDGMPPVDIHEAKDKEGGQWRLPIAANFRAQIEKAGLARGDTFAVLRLPNVTKKKGAGKGNAMEMYKLKVLSKAPVQQSAAA
jgi:hypothetical protein